MGHDGGPTRCRAKSSAGIIVYAGRLVDTDNNQFTAKQVFGSWIVDAMRSHGLMHEEVFSEKGRPSDDGTLERVLVFDISRQARLTLTMGSIDTVNYYHSLSHAIGSLVFQSFGVPEEVI